MAEQERLGGDAGALNVSIHPLVIINISDHFTRKRFLSGRPERVVGLLLGTQEGRNVEIFNSFECVHTFVNDKLVLNQEYLATKMDLYKKTFAKYEPLGWYSTGYEVTDADIEIHKEICSINDNPLYVLLDTRVSAADKELPLQVYESEMHMVSDVATMSFVKTPAKLETVEAERISVEQVSHLQASGSGSTAEALTAHLGGLQSAMRMLNQRVGIITQVMEAMHRGEIPIDHTFLRMSKSLCNRLPAIDTQQFRGQFHNEYNDTLLLTYLTTLTKGANTINDLVDKYNLSYEKQGRRRGLF